MDITLTPQMQRFIASRIKSGQYASSSEVVLESLRLLREQEKRQAYLDQVRKEIAIGLEQADRGEMAPLDMAEIKAAVRKRR